MDAGFSAATQAIIKKLQANFKDATTDAARQIIAEEVERFLKSGGGAEEEDIGALEDAIRNRLAGRGGASGRAERLATKKSLFSRDEWSRIALYTAFMAREDAARAAAANAARKREAAAALQGQAAEAEARRHAEQAKKKEELREVEQGLAQWEQDEKATRARRRAEVDQLKAERERQLEEQANRRQVAAELRRLGDAEASARVAGEVKRQIEAEAAARARAKEELKDFLLSNEANKKEAEAEAERAADLRYAAEMAAQLDRQEAARQALLQKVKAVQNRQAEDAAQRPPVKRWVAEEIIERQFQEKQAALAAEEAQRKAAAAAAAAKFRADVAGQLGEKEAARLAELQGKRAELVALMADLELCKKTEAAAKAAELARMRRFKAELDSQIEENQVRRAVSAMTDTERKLNAKLLREVEAAAAAGIPTVRSPTRSPGARA